MAELQGSKLAGQQAGWACRLQEEGLEQAEDTKTGPRPILQILNSMECLGALWLGAALQPLRPDPQLLGISISLCRDMAHSPSSHSNSSRRERDGSLGGGWGWCFCEVPVRAHTV